MNQKKIGALLAYGNVFVKNISLFICTPIFLKYLGKSEYGIYQMVNAVISNLVILNMGFSFAYIKFYVRESQKENAHIRVGKLNGIYLLLFTGISILILIIGSLLILNKERLFSSSLTEQNTNLVSQLMIIMSVNIAITFFSSIFDAYIAANEQFKFQQSRQLLQTILFPLLTIPLLTLWYSNAVIIVLIQTMISIFVLSSNIIFCKRKLSMAFSFTNLEFYMFKEIGVFSFFIFLNQIFNQINDTAPPLIIGSILGSKQIAIYAIVNQLKSLFFLLSQSFTNIFIPQVNKIVHTNNDSMQLSNVMIKIGKIQVLVLSFFIGGFILLGKYFLLLWLGRGFELAYYLLISVIFPLMIPLSQNIGLEIQQARNKHMFRSIILTIFAILNIFITIFMVSKFGLIGSTAGYIFSLLLGYGFIINLYYYIALKLDIFSFWKSVLPCYVPLTLSVMICYLIFGTKINSFNEFILTGSIYSLIYLGSAALMNYKMIKQWKER